MKRYLILIILLQYSIISFSQHEKDALIFNALEDEMHRGMDSLINSQGISPFLIAYNFYDNHKIFIDAERGYLISSKQIFNKGWGLRLMMGNYKTNDENFSGGSNGMEMDLSSFVDQFPIEDDYYAIRTGFWLQTDKIFKSASKHYNEKLKVIEKNNLQDHELLFDDYIPGDSLTLLIDRDKYVLRMDEYKNLAKNTSKYFNNDTAYTNTESTFNIIFCDAYHTDTEGCKFKVPMDFSVFETKITMDDENGKSHHATMGILAENPNEILKNSELIENDLCTLGKLLKDYLNAEPLKEDYMGPVLFRGNVAYKILMNGLFYNQQKLCVTRQSLNAVSPKKVYFESLSNSFENSIGKKVFPEEISVYSYPRLKRYNGVKLLASSEIDYEGTIPPDTIELVNNGKLLNLLSDRIPTLSSSKSNGHYRMYSKSGGNFNELIPGIIHYIVTNPEHDYEMEQALINYANENAFNYAYIIETIPSSTSLMPYALYRINTKTKDKELIRGFKIEEKISIRQFKDIIAYSDSTVVCNFLLNDARWRMNPMDFNQTGRPVSVICPYSFIISDFEISSIDEINNLARKKEYISKPRRDP